MAPESTCRRGRCIRIFRFARKSRVFRDPRSGCTAASAGVRVPPELGDAEIEIESWLRRRLAGGCIAPPVVAATAASHPFPPQTIRGRVRSCVISQDQHRQVAANCVALPGDVRRSPPPSWREPPGTCERNFVPVNLGRERGGKEFGMEFRPLQPIRLKSEQISGRRDKGYRTHQVAPIPS